MRTFVLFYCWFPFIVTLCVLESLVNLIHYLKAALSDFFWVLILFLFIQGDLKFFVNGECQGVAAVNLPQILYAVVDMYGKCAQVTLTAPSTPDSSKYL